MKSPLNKRGKVKVPAGKKNGKQECRAGFAQSFRFYESPLSFIRLRVKVKTKLVGKAADIVGVVTRNSSLHRFTASRVQFLRLHRDFYESFLLDFSSRAPPAVCFRCKCSASFWRRRDIRNLDASAGKMWAFYLFVRSFSVVSFG